MPFAGHPSPEQLAAYARGELPRAVAELAADHLRDCPHCEATVVDGRHGVDTSERGPRQAASTSSAHGLAIPKPGLGQVREYQLLEKLGDGGMGTMYKARHTKLDKLVGLKVLRAAAMQDTELVALVQGASAVYDTSQGQIRFTIPVSGAPAMFEFSPDSKRMLVWGPGQPLKLWDVTSGALLRTLSKEGEDVRCVAATRDGDWIAGFAAGTGLKLRWLLAGREGPTLPVQDSPILASLTPDDKRFLVVTKGGKVRAWDFRTGQECLSVQGPAGEYWLPALSPDLKRAASVRRDRVSVLDADTGHELITLTEPGQAVPFPFALFYGNGRMLAGCGGPGYSSVWQADDWVSPAGKPRAP